MAGENELEKLTGRVLFTIIAGTVLLTIVSVSVLTYESKQFYPSLFYTFFALFNASGFNAYLALFNLVVPYTTEFYVFTTVAIVDGIAKAIIIGSVLAALINYIRGINIRTRLSGFSLRKLKDHVIICGYSRFAERLCKGLRKRKIPFIVVDKDQEKVELLVELGYTTLDGNFTSEETMKDVALERARAVIFTTSSDFNNLLGIVTVKHLNPKVRILTRTTEEGIVSKMKRAGASLCYVPEVIAGQEIGDSVMSM